MFINTRKLSIKVLFIFTLLIGCSIYSNAQTNCPVGLVCLTQEEANKAAQNARELQATKEKNIALEESLKLEKQNTQDVKDTAKKNEEDLKTQLHKTELELSRTNGLLTAKEQELVRLTAWFEFVMKNGRVKKVGLVNLF